MHEVFHAVEIRRCTGVSLRIDRLDLDFDVLESECSNLKHREDLTCGISVPRVDRDVCVDAAP